MNKILEAKDKEITLKYLLSPESFFHINKSTDFGFENWEVYQENFTKRNKLSIESIYKNFVAGGVKEINESDIDNYFSLLNVAKAVDSNLIPQLMILLSSLIDMVKIHCQEMENEMEIPETENELVDMVDTYKNKEIKKQFYDVQVLKSIEGLVTGLIYEPEVHDSDGNFASKEVIAKMQRNFMLNNQQFDVMHNGQILKSDAGEGRQVGLVQSFIAPQDLTYGNRIIKEGSWLVENQYFDAEILNQIAVGKFTGYSLEGIGSIDPNDLVPLTI